MIERVEAAGGGAVATIPVEPSPAPASAPPPVDVDRLQLELALRFAHWRLCAALDLCQRSPSCPALPVCKVHGPWYRRQFNRIAALQLCHPSLPATPLVMQLHPDGSLFDPRS